MIYKRIFKEYDPKMFQKAKDSGILDNIDTSIPNYIKKYLSRDVKNIKDLKLKVLKNKILDNNARIVIYNNNFYSSEGKDSLHYDILAYLIFFEGLKIDVNEKDDSRFSFYWRYTKTNEFLCLQLGTKYGTNNYGLYLSEIYSKDKIAIIDDYIEQNKFAFTKVIHKLISKLDVDFYFQNL